MSKKIRVFILLLLVVVLMVSSGFFLRDMLQSRAEEAANDELADEVNRLRESVRASSLAAAAAAAVPAADVPASTALAATSAAAQTTAASSVTGSAASTAASSAAPAVTGTTPANTAASAADTSAAGTQTSSAETTASSASETQNSSSETQTSASETQTSAAESQTSAAESQTSAAETKKTTAASTAPKTTQAATTAATANVDPNMLPQYAPLYTRNNDLAGWLTIDGTKIDYAVMYTPDNIEKYIHKGFNGKYAAGGSLFLGEGWFPGSNFSIIYGHHMKNGTMFSTLTNYADASYAAAHPTIRFDTLYKEREFEVVAAFYSKVYGDDDPDAFRYYAYVTLPTQEIFDYYVEQIRAIALYDTGVGVSYGDSLLVLSTCSYHTSDGRFAVLARRR